MAKTIYLMRHGQSSFSGAKAWGSMPNAGLDHKATEIINKRRKDRKFTTIITSPIPRAKETGECFGKVNETQNCLVEYGHHFADQNITTRLQVMMFLGFTIIRPIWDVWLNAKKFFVDTYEEPSNILINLVVSVKNLMEDLIRDIIGIVHMIIATPFALYQVNTNVYIDYNPFINPNDQVAEIINLIKSSADNTLIVFHGHKMRMVFEALGYDLPNPEYADCYELSVDDNKITLMIGVKNYGDKNIGIDRTISLKPKSSKAKNNVCAIFTIIFTIVLPILSPLILQIPNVSPGISTMLGELNLAISPLLFLTLASIVVGVIFAVFVKSEPNNINSIVTVINQHQETKSQDMQQEQSTDESLSSPGICQKICQRFQECVSSLFSTP